MTNFQDINPKYNEILVSRNVLSEQWGVYKKWVRFYLHFCAKHNYNPTDVKSIPYFIKKLASKKQAESQREQARTVVEYYRPLTQKHRQFVIEKFQVTASIISSFRHAFSRNPGFRTLIQYGFRPSPE
jgi:hypothetical protein